MPVYFISQFVVVACFVLSQILPAQAQAPAGPTPLVPPQKSYALVIGIDDYSAWPQLSRAVSDARLVGDALEKQGFQVVRKINLKGDALREALRDFFAEKGHDPATRLFVWYAGHSTTLDVRGEKIGYLVPSDAPRSTNDAKFKSVALPMERVLYDYMRATNARHVLVVFDSCFAGIALARGPAAPQAPLPHWSNPVHHYIAAGTARQSVLDDGLFARLFVDAITGKSRSAAANANGDAFLTGTELGEYLVTEASRRNGEEQTPVHRKLTYRSSADIHAGEFVFNMASSGRLPPSLFVTRAGPKLTDIINSCVTKPRHPTGAAISKRLAEIADVKTNTLDHRPKDVDSDPRWQSIPRDVHNVSAQGDGVHLFYPEGGELVVTPVMQDSPGFVGSDTVLLQGGWMQLGNYGCVEFTFNTSKRSGEGRWWIQKRNRILPEVPGWSQLPLRTTLQILPKSRTP